MKRMLKEPIKALASSLGYEVRKRTPADASGHVFPSDPFDAQLELINGVRDGKVTVFDVGANKGVTIAAYRAKFPDAMIYGFEPSPDLVVKLQSRFSHDAGIRIVPSAVSNEIGHATFHVSDFSPANSLLPRPTSDRRYYPKNALLKSTIEVEVTTLDEFVKTSRIPGIDILKFDIQGAELMALHGAENLLRAGTIPIIYTEIVFVPHYEGGPLFHELCSFLAEFGYSLFDLYDVHRGSNGQIRMGDALFVSKSLRSKVIDRRPDEA